MTMEKETVKTSQKADKTAEVHTTKSRVVAGINLDALVKKAQDSYAKKEAGLSKQLSTGSSLIRPDSDSDYVLWSKGDHWQALTHLKGLPFGRIIQISGKPDSGKSTHAAAFMKFAQDQDVLVILWDAEKKFSPERFNNKIGGNSDNLLLVDTNNIINGAKAVAHFVNAAKEMSPNVKILIVWDSVGACVNSTEDKEDSEDFSQQPGVTAKEIAYAVRKFNKLSNKYINRETGEETISTLIINQTYARIGIGVSGQVEKGGSELYYLSSVIVQLSRKQDLSRVRQGEKYKYGIVTRAKMLKNHLFSGDECIAEMDLVVSADGIHLAKDVKNFDDIKGWDGEEEGDE
jgi:RecA/RadA recombinase